MNTKNIPAIIMLTAGLASSIVMYLMHYELYKMLWTLLLVFLFFYILGLFVKKILDIFCVPKQEEETQQTSEEEEVQEQGKEKEKESRTDRASEKDGSVIEK